MTGTTKDTREFKKLLKHNGFKYKRCKGDHQIYEKNGINIVVTVRMNPLIIKRLIKEHKLKH